MDFGALLQEFVNKDYAELLDLAKQAAERVLPVCKTVDEANNGMAALSAVLLSAIGVDGKLSRLEAQFLADVTGLDADGVDKLTDLYTGNMAELTDLLADKCSKETKADIMILVTCLAACDETISRDETAFLRQILA